MMRVWLLTMAMLLCAAAARANAHAVVADSATRQPLANAAIFDCRGASVAMTSKKGRMPYMSESDYPLTIRYLGYEEKTISAPGSDTIFLQEISTELPEVVVSRNLRVLHMLAYVREYSSLATYTDTVYLFREKMVDFMLPADKKIRFKGWRSPRILKTRSYYRFTSLYGVDSVSDAARHHFSWSDWIGIAPTMPLPAVLNRGEAATDTVYGKYSPCEIWVRNGDKISVDIDALADTTVRHWLPGISGFFRSGLDFEKVKVRFNFNGGAGSDSVAPIDLTGYTYTIDSRGRGRDMFRFNRVYEPFFTSTYAEVYILDKEYISVKEALKWEKHDFLGDTNIEIFEPKEAPPLQASVLDLIRRVDEIDRGQARLGAVAETVAPWQPRPVNKNFMPGHRMLNMLKQLTGITYYKSHKNFKKNWDHFKPEKKNPAK